jgi:hypothetical protein
MLDRPRSDTDALAAIQRSFTEALSRIEGLASPYLRMRRSECKDEAIAETIALAWRSYRELALGGRDVVKLLGRIVEFSARNVRSGGRLVGRQPVRDVMSATARFRQQYAIHSLPLSERDATAPEVIEALREETSPAEEATFRADLEAWLAILDERERAIVTHLREGHSTVEVARLHRVSRMRIYQLRLGLVKKWDQLHEE